MIPARARQRAVERPPWLLLGAEPLRAAKEYAAHLLTRAPSAPPGDGHPVIIFPGLGTNARAVAPLRAHCLGLGYAAMDWGRGYNTGPDGDIGRWLLELAAHTKRLLQPHRQRATLIGWSLGGLYAREVAKLLPRHMRQVITIGTPFNGGGEHTHAAWLYRLLNGTARKPGTRWRHRLRVPPPVPTTSIYSRSDGVVAWETCVHDATGPGFQDVEIDGSHIGMGWNPAVLDVIADRLAQRPGCWRPYPH